MNPSGSEALDHPQRRRSVETSAPFTTGAVQRLVFRRSVGLLALFIALDVIVLGPFLWTSGLPLHSDLSYPLTLERHRADLYPLWNSFGSYSNLEDVDRLLVTLPLVHTAEALGLTMATFIKLITLGTLLLSQVAMFFWVRMLLTDGAFTNRRYIRAHADFAAATAAIFFGFSPWVIRGMSAWYFWLAYAITPLALLLLTWALRDHKPVALIATALAWSVGSGSPQYTLFLGIVLTVWAVFLVGRGIASWRYSAKAFLGLLGVYGLINAFWIWPIVRSWFVQAVTPGYVVSTADVDILSQNATPVNVLLGRDEWLPWWDPAVYSGDTNALWNFIAIGFIGFCCLGIFVARNRVVPFVVAVLVVNFFLSQGSNGPLGDVYTWLMFDAPAADSWGWLIRAPEKFGAFLWFGFATLLAFSTVWLLTKLHETGRPPLLGAACVLSVALFMALPKLVSGTWGLMVPVEVPLAYSAVNDWLGEREGQAKALWLGRYETGAASIGHPEHTWATGRWAGGHAFVASSGAPSYGGYRYTNPFAQYRAFLFENLDSPALWKLLAAQGIGYVVYQNDIKGGGEVARADLANLTRNLEPVFRRGKLRVFRNSRVAPRVSAPSQLVVMHGGMRGLRLLADTSALDPRKATVVFRDQHQALPDLARFNRLDVSYDVSPRDLQIDRMLAARGSIVWPFDLVTNGHPDVGWARVRTSHQFDGEWPWHSYMRGFLNEVDRWELDRGRGIVLTQVEDRRLSVPVKVSRSGLHDVYVRLFRHPHGGSIEVSANGQPVAALTTNGPQQSFGWELVGRGQLRAGRNVVEIVSRSGRTAGHTALAAIGVVPSGLRGSPVQDLSVFVGETTTPGAFGNLAKIVIPAGRPPSVEVFAGRPRTGSAGLRLVPGGGGYFGESAPTSFTLQPGVFTPGEYFALVGRDMRTVVDLRSVRFRPRTSERAVRLTRGTLTARLRPNVRRQQVWRSRLVPLGRSETETRFLAVEVSATSVKNFGLQVVFRRNGRVTRINDVLEPQSGAFNRLFATFLAMPERTETVELRVRAENLTQGSGKWQIRRLDVTGVGEVIPYSTVLVGGSRLATAMNRARENAVFEPSTDSPTGPLTIELRRPSVVRLAESHDAYWSGETGSGVQGRQLIAFGSINAFAVPQGGTPFEIEYSPQRWTVQGATLSLGALALLGIGLFVRTRRWLNSSDPRSADERTPLGGTRSDD
jgi:hypothetical protein